MMKLVLSVTVLVAFASILEATMFGISGPVPRLETIQVQSAAQKDIGPALPHELEGEQLSSIDAAKKRYYLVTYNTTDKHVYLISVSLTTGLLTSSTQLPFKDSAFIGVGQSCNVMPESGDVLVVGRDRILAKHHILQVNPDTGDNKVIASIGDVDVLGAASAYDHINKVLWLQFGLKTGIYNFAFEIPSGKILHQIDDKLNLETMDFDSKTQKVIGVGLDVKSSHDYERVLLTLDSKTGNMDTISTIPGYFLIRSAESGLNVPDRELSVFLQLTKDLHNATAPFELVTLDADTGAIRYKPTIIEADLPWSIAYAS
eukprot:TRINITY_DN6761_c0_g1_i1.p1 TRINITY_DN6761_c0_g1~~TRINITY_DN6761_c0_g1_i1.p1  ORF type:complete len:316 (-),score=47.18 TRINITY_DN6761_c0_g1_i1:77-1024(-)